jgi:hypothetical protein
MTLPNFLIIGAPKCGTTSVYHYLRQHPDVFMPDRKEPKFFAYEGGMPLFNSPDGGERDTVVTSIEAYRALFDGVTTERAVGEASTTYLYWPDAVHRIHRYLPNPKLIAILRNPVERAYSNFLHQRRWGREPVGDFAAALRAEPERIAQNWGPFWHYLAQGRYRSQLERYHRVFERKSIRVYLYDDLVRDPLALLRDIFRFLEVDDAFVPDVSLRYQVSSQQRVPSLGRLVRSKSRFKVALRPLLPDPLRRFLIEREAKWNHLPGPTIDARLHRRLIEEHTDEISKLAALLDKDLSSWLEPRPKR